MTTERAGLLTTPAPAVRVTTRLPVPALQRQCTCGTHASTDQECEECRTSKTRDDVLQRSAVATGPRHAPAIVGDVLRSPGHLLDRTARSFAESRLGHDFSHVRVHTDARASESAHAVGAAAYTVGHHVVFASGRYAPGDPTGRRLLAHELAHVLQQGPRAPAHGSLRVAPAGSGAEQEADRVADEAVRADPGQGTGAVTGSQRTPAATAAAGGSYAGSLQRQPMPRPPLAQVAPPQGPAPAGPQAEADPGRDEVLAAAQRTGDLQPRAWEMAYKMLARYFPEHKDSVSGVSYQEGQRGVRVQTQQVERNGKRSLSFTVIVGRWFVDQVTDENLRIRIEAMRYAFAAAQYPQETVRTGPDAGNPESAPAIQSLETIIRESFPLKRRRISRLSYDANQPGLRTEFGTVRLHVERSQGGTRQWALDVAQSGPQLFFGKAFLAMQRADQNARLKPELLAIDKWCVENARITKDDLQDEDIRLRIRGLSRAQLIALRDGTKDADVRAYADSLTGTSTPLEQGLTRAPDGSARLQVGNVTIVVNPDQAGVAGVEGGETSFNIPATPAMNYHWDARGRIDNFTPIPAQVTITIQTRYGPGADPSGQSGYGRGTTEHDVETGGRTLRVHEGSHGLDYVEFIRNTPYPTFDGQIGDTRRQFEAKMTRFREAREAFHRGMDAISLARTDCVGVTIDEFNRRRRRRVPARCRRP